MISFQFIALAHLYIQRCAIWTPRPVRTRVEAVTVMLLECQNLGAGPPYALRGVADDASFFPPFYCNRSVLPLWVLSQDDYALQHIGQAEILLVFQLRPLAVRQ